ncbi:hypothetical protein [Streptomyces spectabilis]|uniref:ATP-grasp domain-containing protein n=1 Tax=Streptomyces spectabilis TaxID=68270 RepID=A0A5P2X692_STRST|nr:hypothetical protein [Streptomyces spectabilis]MBB5108413.1 hypothetical protein [Streptomyces spectabilis]MCI3901165.1 hypothetical protein [Streptomyces spectabilis]QEV58655.1 hypothetical protein CP982_07910 [Streptomyces spectabilis]GGV46362.1 hypothetical protein GCM10010245_72760 [Streptomyces spectabilis]
MSTVESREVRPARERWEVALPDGRVVPWTGFHVGPAGIAPRELAHICRRLLGMGPAEAEAAARVELSPAGAARDRPGIVAYSPPMAKRMFEGALESLAAGEPAEDWPTILEARSVCLAHTGDLLIGRTAPWKEAAAGRPVVVVPDHDHFHLSHALLRLADGPADQWARVLGPAIDRLRADPACVVRVYALDEPMRILLLWLKRVAGVDRLLVEANAPEITEQWGHKAVLHPAARTAHDLSVPPGRAPFDVLDAETELTPLYRVFGLAVPRLPGYVVLWDGEPADAVADGGIRTTPGDVRVPGTPGDEQLGNGRAHRAEDSFAAQLVLAAQLLRERHGLRVGCLKPVRGGTGQRIHVGVPLDDPDVLAALARQAARSGEDYLLEAHADYLRHAVTGHEFLLAPSVHVRAGALADGMALQFLNGTMWEGNVFLDESTHAAFGITRSHYTRVRHAMADFVRLFQGRGLINGGVDFAIARVGGRYGDTPLVAMQDLNLSACGADYLHAFLAESRTELGALAGTGAGISAATKVIRPASDMDLPRLRRLVDHRTPTSYARALTSVPGNWGLIAVACPDAVRAAEEVLAIEARLTA